MLMRTPHRWVRPKRLQPPGFIVPCQPTLADKVPAGDGWIHELKHDGLRILAFKDGERVLTKTWGGNGDDPSVKMAHWEPPPPIPGSSLEEVRSDLAPGERWDTPF
jgi:hypothetical protein